MIAAIAIGVAGLILTILMYMEIDDATGDPDDFTRNHTARLA